MNDREKPQQQLVEEAAELRQSLDALIHNLPEGFLIVDSPDANIRLASRYGLQMLGVSWEDVKGVHGDEHLHIYQVFFPDGATPKLEQMPLARAIFHGEVIRNEEWLLQLRDGGRIPILCHAGPIRDPQGTITGAVISWQDITDRKQAEEALRQGERRFHSLFHDSAVGMVVIAPNDNSFLQANPAFCHFLGYSEEELLGKTVQSVTYAEDIEVSSKAIERAMKSGPHTDRYEKRYLHKSGRILWGEVNYSLVCDAEGKPTYFIAQVLDIAERKQAEEALQRSHAELEQRVEERTAELAAVNERLQREIEDRKAIEETLRRSEEMHRRLLEASPDAVLMADFQGKILFASRQTWRLIGLSDTEELAGQNIFDFVIEDDRRRLAENMVNLIEVGVRKHTEYAVFRQDGTTIPVEISSALIRDAQGHPAAIMAVIRDVMERKAAENALQQSHEELKGVHDSMVDGLIVTDIATQRFLRVNASICRMLGYSEKELLALSIQDIHPAETLPLVLEKIDEVKQIHQTLPGIVPVMRKDGSVFPAEIIGKFLTYNGSPCSMGIFRDITERKQAEDALERERQSLWRMLQASDHERQTISYEIHDGLAQYLAAALMQFQAHGSLRKDLPQAAEKAYETAVELVRQAHSESRRLISEVRPPVIDESGLETAISHLICEQRRHGGPEIECRSSVRFGRLPTIMENALYRIAQEALTNACKHSKSRNICVTLAQEGRDFRLEIQDWGVGFDPAAIGKGHFGLEGIRQRARLLDGRLSIESAPGSGTLVQVVVPILSVQNELYFLKRIFLHGFGRNSSGASTWIRLTPL